MLELQLHPEAEALLERFAAQAGQTKAEFARRAILDSIEDREDYELGVAALKDAADQPTYSLEEVVKALDLEDSISSKSPKTTRGIGQGSTTQNHQVRERKTHRVA